MSLDMPHLPLDQLTFSNVDSALVAGGTNLAISQASVGGGMDATTTFAQNIGMARRDDGLGI